jgi:chaperone required for assembly of F1-ATPase
MAGKKPIDDLAEAFLPQHGEPIDPIAMARRDMTKSLPKRFYKEAAVIEADGLFHLALDGRLAKTPAKNKLALPTRAAGEAIAAEWQEIGELIDPLAMPITRIVNSAIDGVKSEMQAVLEETVKFSGSDLICYRAGDPVSLAEAQSAHWDPLLALVRENTGARFICAEGIMFAAQPPESIASIRQAIKDLLHNQPEPALLLASLNVMTTLTGSAIIALAVAWGDLSPDQAWAAAHVDEDFQMRIWGADDEALQRRARRWKEMEAAAKLFQLCQAERV